MSAAPEPITPLRAAFVLARDTNDMGVVLPVFLRSTLFLVAVREEEARLSPYITPSPIPERMCVTVAERREFLAGISPSLVHETDARTLIRNMVGRWDIVIMNADGADILHLEYLPDLRAMMDAAG